MKKIFKEVIPVIIAFALFVLGLLLGLILNSDSTIQNLKEELADEKGWKEHYVEIMNNCLCQYHETTKKWCMPMKGKESCIITYTACDRI